MPRPFEDGEASAATTLPRRSNWIDAGALSSAPGIAPHPAFGSDISIPRQETALRVSHARMTAPGCQSLKPIAGIPVRSRSRRSYFLSFHRTLPELRTQWNFLFHHAAYPSHSTDRYIVEIWHPPIAAIEAAAGFVSQALGGPHDTDIHHRMSVNMDRILSY
ncbi:hypothetical protein [Methylobacterium mesophilicum]|uniref:hypothetical protein n=1 Tax=Methylobacterium mesophilicum TaxID=39956 RepID=UPI002F3528AD